MRSEVPNRRSRHRSGASNDSLSMNSQNDPSSMSQCAPSPSSSVLGNGQDIVSMQVNRSRDDKHGTLKHSDKHSNEDKKSNKQASLKINLDRLNSSNPKEGRESKPKSGRGRRGSNSSSDKRDQSFDASKELRPGPNFKQRRGSMVESRTEANQEFFKAQKEVRVRTPRRGRSKSIVVPGTNSIPRSFPIGRLNNYNKTMKKHKAPLSFVSELESIDEVELSDKFDSSNKNSRDFSKNEFFHYDADEEKKSFGNLSNKSSQERE